MCRLIRVLTIVSIGLCGALIVQRLLRHPWTYEWTVTKVPYSLEEGMGVTTIRTPGTLTYESYDVIFCRPDSRIHVRFGYSQMLVATIVEPITVMLLWCSKRFRLHSKGFPIIAEKGN